MKIAFYKSKNGTWLDKLISLVSFSKYSHCEIVFPDGTFASSSKRDGGIRLKSIVINDHWDVFELNGVCDSELIKYWFYMNMDNKYDWVGAVGSLFYIDLTSDDKKFCSYACATVLGIDSIITPGGLYRALKKSNIINV